MLMREVVHKYFIISSFCCEKKKKKYEFPFQDGSLENFYVKIVPLQILEQLVQVWKNFYLL